MRVHPNWMGKEDVYISTNGEALLTLTTLIAWTMAMSGSATGQAPAAANVLPLAFIGAVREIQPPTKAGAWVLQVISRGGLDGRGTGDLEISSDGAFTLPNSDVVTSAPPEILRSLGQHIQTTTPNQWTAGSRLGTCSDCLATLIRLTLRDADGSVRTQTAFWDPTTRQGVQPEVLRIHALALTISRR